MDRSSCLQLIYQSVSLPQALKAHARVAQLQFYDNRDVFLANKLVEMYGRCGSVKLSKQVFDEIVAKDCFTWVLMLQAYARNGYVLEAKSVFDSMPAWNLVAWTALLTCFAEAGMVAEAKQVFDSMPERDVPPWIVMLTAYARTGDLARVEQTLSSLEVVSLSISNVLLSAFAANRQLGDAKRIFDSMPERDLVTWNALLAAYAQNGRVDRARRLFLLMPEHDVVSWTAVLCSYAHGGGSPGETLETFDVMKLVEVPDGICFNSVLLACSHTGVVSLGWRCFTSMISDFNVNPLREHYSCLISLLCRAGYLADAEELLHNMPFVPSGLDWRCYLGACRSQRSRKSSEAVKESAINSAPEIGSSYVLLSDIYRGDTHSEE